jgi:hypothetical protein
VDLEHLGDRGQPFRDGIVAAGLADLKVPRATPSRRDASSAPTLGSAASSSMSAASSRSMALGTLVGMLYRSTTFRSE